MKTILLIEDNEIMRENTAEILELSNYKVLIADNGRRGIELAVALKPDLIICDIAMPEVDGYEVLKKIKTSSAKKIPFIFLTARAEKVEIINGITLGADEYITKPYDGEKLLQTVVTQLCK
jgi:CheY-like chemotaxis protein